MDDKTKQVILKAWDKEFNDPKVSTLQKAINVLSFEILWGPSQLPSLHNQINTGRFIEKHFPESWKGDLVFNDYGYIVTDDQGRPVSIEKFENDTWDSDYQFQREQELDNVDEIEHSHFWLEIEKPETLDEKTHYYDESTQKYYEFNEYRFSSAFSCSYEPDWSFCTVATASEVQEVILGHCLELVEVNR
jgi:hypothetical protein